MLSVNKYTEEELLGLLRNKNADAFSYLYDNYSAALYGVIYKIIEDKELAEDILQESFVKIWNNFNTYDQGKGRLFTWMLNITRNLTIDTLRSRDYKKQNKIYNNNINVDNVVDVSSHAERFDALGIRKHLTRLKKDQKQIIDLAYFLGFTHEEIARQLSIPLGTVKTRMRAAIMELRKLLKK